MTRISDMRPVAAFLIGAFWINTTLVLAAAVDVLRAELPKGQSLAVFAAFTLGTLSVQGALSCAGCGRVSDRAHADP
jgi:hypothetical protein